MQSKLKVILAAAGTALLLAGCGGGGGSDKTVQTSCPTGQTGTPPNCVEPKPEPTAYQAGLAAINAATTAEAAQAAYDAVDQAAVSGDESAKLRTALADQLAAFALAGRVSEQKKR